MTLLHDFFHAKNIQGFQRLLDGSNDKKQAAGSSGAAGTSGGHRPSPLNSTVAYVDVNSRDWLGRSVLHLVVTSNHCLEYLRLLLKHPNVNVNLADVESQWTPLHRALYHANIPAAYVHPASALSFTDLVCSRLLLQRSDIDISLKDKEGYTAFDVYNSTLHGTKPDLEDRDAELFTWGANRCVYLLVAHVLRLTSAPGMAHWDWGTETTECTPTRSCFSLRKSLLPRCRSPNASAKYTFAMRKCPNSTPVSSTPSARGMSDIPSAVVTSESSGNLRVCGFGSGGRCAVYATAKDVVLTP